MWSNALRDALCAKEAEHMITVFTPTYNRAYILPKLYASLRTQTSDNFEWVIVDDGSTDETKRLVTGWLSDNNKFCVRYYNREMEGSTALSILECKWPAVSYFLLWIRMTI